MKPLLFSLTALTLLCHCAAPTGTSGGNKAALATATKEQPFVNSLGMKFVPVPGTNILMCTTETTVAQYQQSGLRNEAPPFEQGPNHPVVKVSWLDAKAWCVWLSKKEGRKYRLPTSLEWHAAVGNSTYPWGNQWPPPNYCGNYMGQESKGSSQAVDFHRNQGWSPGMKTVMANFKDNHVFTAPVGAYPPNQFGIHDLGGNVWEFCEDRPQRKQSIRRGGGWQSAEEPSLKSSSSIIGLIDYRLTWEGAQTGFRIVQEL